MARILIVDDEEDFLNTLLDRIQTSKQKFSVLTALNGREAVKVLKKNEIDLVVTDLKMPKMDGFELMAWISVHFPSMSVVAMSAFLDSAAETNLHTEGIRFLPKPIDFSTLMKIINEELDKSDNYLDGISLPSFLQLLEMEGKSCAVQVRADGGKGWFHFRGGMLWAVNTGEKEGMDAAVDMLQWQQCKLQINRVKKIKRNITHPLSFVLLEACRVIDEQGLVEAQKEELEDQKGDGPANESASGSNTPTGEEALPHPSKERTMALEKHLEELRSINGYKASAIMSFTGEILAADSTDDKIDLNMVGATFNDIFRGAHAACEKIGLEACHDTVIATPKGVVCMHCSGVKAKTHTHFIGILAADGNQALMKMTLDKMSGPVVDELG